MPVTTRLHLQRLVVAVVAACACGPLVAPAFAQRDAGASPAARPPRLFLDAPPRILAGTVAGRVTDKDGGAPIAGAAVSVDGTRLGNITDEQGRYRIAGVPAGTYTVSARRIGYGLTTQKVTVTDGADAAADFAMAKAATNLEAVITTETGLQRKVEIGNAIASLNSDSLVLTSPITRFGELISGRVPSVQVMQNSGITGSSPRIRIRGFNSTVNSNDPLVIIDGIRVEASAGGAAGLGWTAGRMSDFNVEDIESLDIVKGPSAATLYGTDAANGVIVIKTKKGSAGQAHYTAYAERGTITQPSPFHDTYYAFGRSATTGTAMRCQNYLRASGACTLDSVSKWNPMRQSLAGPVGTGQRDKEGLQITGGVQQFRYYLSGDHENEVGYLTLSPDEINRFTTNHGGTGPTWDQIHPNFLRRVSMRGNVASELSTQADVSLTTSLILQTSQVPQGSSGSGVFANGAWGSGYNDALEGWYGTRPAELFSTRNAENVTRTTNSFNGNWRPASWLATRGTLGVDFTSDFYDNLQRRGDLGPTATGQRQNIKTATTLYTADFGGTGTFDLRAGVNSKSSLGLQFNRREQLTSTAIGSNLPPGSSTLAGAATLSSSESTVQSVVAGAYGEETVGLGDRLFLTAAVRADGGSSFGKNFKTAVYPKASLSWVVSKEPWFRGFAGLTNVRYRLAFGTSGVQPSSTAALPLASLVTVFINGAGANGARISSIGNQNLKPERQREYETGLDLEFLDGRIRTEATYYDRLSSIALVNRSFPSSLGIGARQENLGAVSNQGWEGSVTGRLIDRAQAALDLTLSGSINHNLLKHLDPSVVVPTGQYTPGQFIRYVQGYPLYGQWDLPFLGYKDANGDGVISFDEVTVGSTLVYIGNPNPTRLLTATPQLSLLRDRLTISSLFEYKGGWIQTNFSELNKCAANFGSCRGMNDPKAPLIDQAHAMAFNKIGANFTYAPYVEDGTFTRWREASITYVLGARLAAYARAQSASVTLSARNLHLWTKYTGLDPEVTSFPSLNNNTWDLGYDNPVSPQSRYWIAKMNLRF